MTSSCFRHFHTVIKRSWWLNTTWLGFKVLSGLFLKEPSACMSKDKQNKKKQKMCGVKELQVLQFTGCLLGNLRLRPASDLQKTLVTHSRDGKGFISRRIPSNTRPDGGQMVPTNAAKKKWLLVFEQAGAGCCTFEALRGVGPTHRGDLHFLEVYLHQKNKQL